MAGTYAHPLARKGRMEDKMIAHVARGEMIVPEPILRDNPNLAKAIALAIRNAGVDPRKFMVGDDMDENPNTGHPEFGFFKKIFQAATKVAPVLIGAALAAPTGGLSVAAGGALGGAAGSALRGGDIGQIIQGAGYGYGAGGLLEAGAAGYNAYNAASGLPASGSGIAWDSAATTGLKATGSSLAGMTSPATKILGALGQAGGLVTPPPKPQAAQLAEQRISNPSPSPLDQPQFFPKRPQAQSRPTSLNELMEFSPEQERSYLATRGVNVGLGADEKSYYTNLVQRSLIGDGDQLKQGNELLPIESQYFSRGGYNTSDMLKFLQQLQG